MKKLKGYSWSTDSEEPAPLWVSGLAIIFILVGVIMLCSSGYLYWKEKQFDKTKVSTSGVVIDLDQSKSMVLDESHSNKSYGRANKSRREVIHYRPIVQFTDQQGKIYQLKSLMSSSQSKYQPGDRVSVVYELGNPESAVIDDEDRYYDVIFLGGMGLSFTFLGALFLWITVKSRKQNASE